MKRKLVMVGNGMAGVAFVEQLLKLNPNKFEITIIGAEPHPNYNRIMLSSVLAGDAEMKDIVLNDWDWYRDNHIMLHVGHAVTQIDTAKKTVHTDQGLAVPYDELVLATGSHDWSSEISRQVTGLQAEDAGSVAPDTLTGDHFAFAEQVGAQVRSIPAWAAPVLPGYRLSTPAFEGDTGFRPCYEHCVPHTFIVNREGERFCDDSFHPSIVAAALQGDGSNRPNVPLFMIWDEQHHQKYGLGATAPGDDYPEGLVESAPTLEELADRLGIDPAGLEATATRFNEAAARNEDPEFGRGSNASVRRFRGDNNAPHPNIAPVEQAPFFGMRLRLLNTGIASGGLRTTDHGKVLAEDGSVIPGLYAVGECAVRSTGGGGYNSGYSLSRAMTFGWLAANDLVAAR